MALSCLAASKAWGKFEESGKKSRSFTKIPKEAFTIFFLQRLTLTVNRIVSDPKDRQVLIEPLAFENANSEFKWGN